MRNADEIASKLSDTGTITNEFVRILFPKWVILGKLFDLFNIQFLVSIWG